jgi:hypothetical protein
MNRYFLILTVFLFISGCGSDSDNQSNLNITGSWQRNGIPHDEIVTDNTWAFKSSGIFTLNSRLAGTDIENTNSPNVTGTFEIGSEVKLATGMTATNITIRYDNIGNSLASAYTPAISGEVIPDIIYIQDDTLYLGKRSERALEACRAILLTNSNQSELIDQYENNAFSTSTEQQASCYVRPTELDFENPLFKIK